MHTLLENGLGLVLDAQLLQEDLLPALVEIRFRFSQVISHLGSLPQASTRGDS